MMNLNISVPYNDIAFVKDTIKEVVEGGDNFISDASQELRDSLQILEEILENPIIGE